MSSAEPHQDLDATSIVLSLHPFTNICRAALKPHTIRFGTRQKPHYCAIDKPYVLQVQDGGTGVRVKRKESRQLVDGLPFNSASQHQVRGE